MSFLKRLTKGHDTPQEPQLSGNAVDDLLRRLFDKAIDMKSEIKGDLLYLLPQINALSQRSSVTANKLESLAENDLRLKSNLGQKRLPEVKHILVETFEETVAAKPALATNGQDAGAELRR
jgi:hypothetical protein